jgi:hypothetical protein
MNIALVLQHKLLLGLQRFLGGATGASAQPMPLVRSHTLPGKPPTPCPASVRQGSQAVLGNRHLAAKVMPLRVLRVVDSGMPLSSTGRLVISGRMADVCAELDRLVEREAALH